jgi:hypothetical protein
MMSVTYIMFFDRAGSWAYESNKNEEYFFPGILQRVASCIDGLHVNST